MMISAKDIRKGMVLNFEKQLCYVMSVVHLTPGNLRAQVQVKMQNIESGSNVEHRFRSDEAAERAQLDTQEMEFLYHDGDQFFFMNTETYEQVELHKDIVGDAAPYMLPNTKMTVDFYEGRAIGIELPKTVDLKITESEPGLKNATVTTSLKAAVCETGLRVQVPQFVEEGDVITVNTETGEYLRKAKE